ncbi:hypothetical protein ACJQWK_11103 [Exserohilum turcicum]
MHTHTHTHTHTSTRNDPLVAGALRLSRAPHGAPISSGTTGCWLEGPLSSLLRINDMSTAQPGRLSSTGKRPSGYWPLPETDETLHPVWTCRAVTHRTRGGMSYALLSTL